MRRNLTIGGLLVFDLNTLLTYRTVFAGCRIVKTNGPDLLWTGFARPNLSPGSECEALFEAEGCGTNFSMAHRQRHFPETTALDCIADAGLECLAVFGQGEFGTLVQPLDESKHRKAIYIARDRESAGAGSELKYRLEERYCGRRDRARRSLVRPSGCSEHARDPRLANADERARAYVDLTKSGRELDRLLEKLKIRLGPPHAAVDAFEAAGQAVLEIHRTLGQISHETETLSSSGRERAAKQLYDERRDKVAAERETFDTMQAEFIATAQRAAGAHLPSRASRICRSRRLYG